MCASSHPCVMRLSVLSRPSLHTLHLSLPIFHFILLNFDFYPFPLPCGCCRSKIPCAHRPMKSLTLWPITPLSQVMSPTSSMISTTQRPLKFFLQEPSSDALPSYLFDAELDDDTIGTALSSPLFTQEREEPASRRQAYHSLEESLLPAQSFFRTHKNGETRA